MFSIPDRYQFPLQSARLPGDPIFRNDWPVKRWKDPSAAGKASVSYQFFNGSDTAPALISVTISGDEAASVNMPGIPQFNAYVVAPTEAGTQVTIGNFTTGFQPLPNAEVLSTREQADALAAICGGAVIDPYAGVPNIRFIANGETRYPWKIQFGYGKGPRGPADYSRNTYAGLLVKAHNSHGVGAPGAWDPTQLAQGLMTWVPAVIPDGSNDPLGELLPPMVLQPGEKLQSIMVGAGVFTPVIVNANEAVPSLTGGSSSVDLTSLMSAIGDVKTYLISKLGA